MVIKAKLSSFSFMDHQKHLRKLRFCSQVYFQTVFWLFYAFRVMASSLLCGFSAHVGTGLVPLWIMTLVAASASSFTSSFAFVLGLICAFCTKTLSFREHRTHLLPEQDDGRAFTWCWYLNIIVWTDKRGVFRHLEIVYSVMNHSGGRQFSSWYIDYFFPMVSHKRAMCFRPALNYINRCASNWQLKSGQQPKTFKAMTSLIRVWKKKHRNLSLCKLLT